MFGARNPLLGWVGEGCPVQSKVFSGIPGLYPPDTRNNPPAPSPCVATKQASRHCQMSLGGKVAPRAEMKTGEGSVCAANYF